MKPCININRKRFVRYKEGAEMYSMCQSKFEQMAKDAKAIYKVDKLVLVRVTDKELQKLKDYADSHGMTITQLLHTGVNLLLQTPDAEVQNLFP